MNWKRWRAWAILLAIFTLSRLVSVMHASSPATAVAFAAIGVLYGYMFARDLVA